MNFKKMKRVAAGVVLTGLLSVSAVFGGCSGIAGRDGANGKDLTVYDLYEAAKTQPGNENMTLDEFLREYLSYNSGELENYAALEAAVNRSLMSGVSIRANIRENNGGQVVNTSYFGSGVILDVDRDRGDMTVLTNCHVVYSAKGEFNLNGILLDGYSNDVTMWLYGSEYSERAAVGAEIIATSKSYDVALLKVSGSDVVKRSYARAAEWTSDEEIYLGETVYAIGNANANKMSASVGYVSKDLETVIVNIGGNYNYNVIRVSAAINHGNSGGGLFDRDGALVGLVNSKSREDTGGYALPASETRRLAERMLKNYNGTETHGVSVIRHGISADAADFYSTGLNADGFAELYEEVEVTGVAVGKAYEKLKKGDVIKNVKVTRGTGENTQTVEDVPINRVHNFEDVMLSVMPGDTVTITYLGADDRVQREAVMVFEKSDLITLD